MEQMKILNLYFGRECEDRKMLVKIAISKVNEKCVGTDREEVGRRMRGARVDILGKCTSPKETGKGRIYSASSYHVCLQEHKGQARGLVKESWDEHIVPMAEGVYGICGQNSGEGGHDGIWQKELLHESKTNTDRSGVPQSRYEEEGRQEI